MTNLQDPRAHTGPMARTSVYLNVEDAHRSIDFYEGLGFKTMERHEAENGHLVHVALDLEGARLGLGEIAAVEDDPDYEAWVSSPLGAGVIVSFHVGDAEAVFERAQAIDATIERPLNEHMGVPSFTVNDPDGYVVTFIEADG